MFSLSIIIPHYNDVSGMKRLLQSIPDEPIDILIIDDQSAEDVVVNLVNLVHLEQAKRKYTLLTLLRNTGTKSAGACRNLGLQQAQGKYLLFADADDIFVPYFYQMVLPYFAQEKDIVFFEPISVLVDTKKVGTRHKQYAQLVRQYLNKPSLHTETSLALRFIVPWSKLYRKQFIIDHELAFDETLVSNDVMFSTKAGYLAKNISASSQTIYCVTQGGNSLTIANLTEARTAIRIEIAINRIKYLQKMKVPKEYQSMDYWVKYLIQSSLSLEFKWKMLQKMQKVVGKSRLIESCLFYYYWRIKWRS